MTSTYDSTGITLDRYADILARLIELGESQWGESLDTSESELIGHLYRLVSLLVGETNEIVQAVYDSKSVTNATGTQLDALMELVGIERASAAFSTAEVTITVTQATTVPAGFQVRTEANVIFETDDELVFGVAGSSDVDCTCTVTGPNNAAAGDINTIVTPLFGVSSVTNAAAAIPGRNRATDAELKADHTTAVATSGDDDIASIYEAVDAVTGVSATYIFENDTEETIGGVPPHNIHVSVTGGTDEDVATAISNNKTAGIPTWGSESYVVYNETTSQAKTIYFDRAVDTDIYITLSISTPGNFPDDGTTQIKNNLITHFGTFRINDDVIYNQLYGPIYDVAGLVVNTMTVGTTPNPTGTTDVAITALQRAVIESNNIQITIV